MKPLRPDSAREAPPASPEPTDKGFKLLGPLSLSLSLSLLRFESFFGLFRADSGLGLWVLGVSNEGLRLIGFRVDEKFIRFRGKRVSLKQRGSYTVLGALPKDPCS